MPLSVRRKCSLSSFPTLLLQRVKPKAITLHQTFLPFYIETVLGFEVRIQMVLKESMGPLKASGRCVGGGAGSSRRCQEAPETDNVSQEPRLCSLREAGLQPPTSPTQKVSSSETGFVFGWILCPGLSHQASWQLGLLRWDKGFRALFDQPCSEQTLQCPDLGVGCAGAWEILCKYAVVV